MSLNDKLTALANSIRVKSGTTGVLSLDGMKTAVDSITTGGITPTGSITLTEEGTFNVTTKAQAVVDFSSTRADLAEAITAKGMDTLPTASFDTIATNIGLIEGGGIDALPYIVTFKKITVASDSTSFTFPLDLPNATSDNTPIVYIFNPNWATDRNTENWRAYGAAYMIYVSSGSLTARRGAIWTDEGSGGTNQGWIVSGVSFAFNNGSVVCDNTKGCKWLAGSTYYCFAITLKDWN